MAPTIELALNDIIVKSQQLLLKLDDMSNDKESPEKNITENITKNITIKSKKSSQNSVENITDTLVTLQSERAQLIHNLFQHYSSDDLQAFLPLVNQVVSLDEILITKSLAFKQTTAKQLIQLKKGKKSTQAYQKY